MLDRMSPNGTWYDSETTAESEEPIGIVIQVDVDPVIPLILWRAYYRGEALLFQPDPGWFQSYLFPSVGEAQRTVGRVSASRGGK